jgi:hypothetical protein
MGFNMWLPSILDFHDRRQVPPRPPSNASCIGGPTFRLCTTPCAPLAATTANAPSATTFSPLFGGTRRKAQIGGFPHQCGKNSERKVEEFGPYTMTLDAS